ncbi:hypothetical protein GW17_00002306, partial [Ensete ventricosum]
HLLSFSVVLECESLFFGRRSPELPVRLPCPLNISLAIPNPGKDLRDVEWSADSSSSSTAVALSVHVLHITCSTQCLGFFFCFGQNIAIWLSGFVRIRVCSGYRFLFTLLLHNALANSWCRKEILFQ